MNNYCIFYLLSASFSFESTLKQEIDLKTFFRKKPMTQPITSKTESPSIKINDPIQNPVSSVPEELINNLLLQSKQTCLEASMLNQFHDICHYFSNELHIDDAFLFKMWNSLLATREITRRQLDRTMQPLANPTIKDNLSSQGTPHIQKESSPILMEIANNTPLSTPTLNPIPPLDQLLARIGIETEQTDLELRMATKCLESCKLFYESHSSDIDYPFFEQNQENINMISSDSILRIFHSTRDESRERTDQIIEQIIKQSPQGKEMMNDFLARFKNLNLETDDTKTDPSSPKIQPDHHKPKKQKIYNFNQNS